MTSNHTTVPPLHAALTISTGNPADASRIHAIVGAIIAKHASSECSTRKTSVRHFTISGSTMRQTVTVNMIIATDWQR